MNLKLSARGPYHDFSGVNDPAQGRSITYLNHQSIHKRPMHQLSSTPTQDRLCVLKLQQRSRRRVQKPCNFGLVS